jgi:hypothetical protein
VLKLRFCVVSVVATCCALVASGGAAATGTVAVQTPAASGAAGTWGNVATVAGLPNAKFQELSAGVDSLSCTAAGDCVAGGYYNVGKTGSSTRDLQAFVVDESGGTWGTAQEVPGMTSINTNGYLTAVASVSCVSATDCAAGGSYGYAGADWPNAGAFVVDKSVHQPTATAVTMSAPRVVYGAEQAEHVSVKVTAGAGGTPAGTVTVTSGGSTVCTITLSSGRGSCPLAARRFPAGRVKVAASYRGGFVFGASASAAAGFTVTKAGTRTSLKLSAGKVTYGHEQSEKLSVTVSPKYAGPPAGKVTIKAGRTTVCVITLKSGKGTCTLTAKKLPAGAYHLTAAYPGSTDFAGSASAKETLTIAQ